MMSGRAGIQDPTRTYILFPSIDHLRIWTIAEVDGHLQYAIDLVTLTLIFDLLLLKMMQTLSEDSVVDQHVWKQLFILTSAQSKGVDREIGLYQHSACCATCYLQNLR